ncbi:exonuclease domain-containing protein [Corynebacterium hansenii]|uniref:Exonuclease domain-containing protein n=1 Tax=Corynebacterium hansenii TaxID=394964 RepID=A0ABV7ZLX3_9CORY|nr:exonuclease domain-containing protein [Corynebacterium hansenii]WJY99435.1 DNA polymerase III subunit epsilon [Corynebacterium hansenii]
MSDHSFAVIDLETTGFSNSDRIIEIGVVLTDSAGKVQKRWRTLVQPNRGFDNGFVHGISPSDLVDAPLFEDVALRVADLLNGRVIVAHNASFEKRFLALEFARAGLELPESGAWLLDTVAAAKNILPGPSYKLSACLDSIGVTNGAAHSALSDADATAHLLEHLLPWMAADLEYVEPLRFDDFDLAVLPASTAPLLVRDDGLFADDEDTEAESDDWMRRITAAAPGIGDEAADAYMGLLADAMVDDRLDADEIARLLDAAHQLELSDDDVAALHEQYLKQVSIEAWADGVVTPEERERLLAIADELSVGRAAASVWLAEPLGQWRVVSRDGDGESAEADDEESGGELVDVVLRPGDRVTFTGAMAISREEWERRATDAGLDVGGVCRRSRVLVAADVESRSGKAKKAREIGVPIIGEREFAKALAAMPAPGETEETGEPRERGEGEAAEDVAATSAVDSADAADAADSAILDLGRLFPWSADVPHRVADASDIVETWLSSRADAPLHAMSPVLDPATRPEGVDVGLKTTMTWFTAYPEPLAASVEDLRDLRHVGRVKVRSFVYATVLQAIDDAELLDGHPETPDVASDFYGVDGEPEGVAADELDPADIVAGWAALVGGWPSSSEKEPPAALPEIVRDALETVGDPAERVIGRALAEIDRAVGVDDLRRAAILDGRIMDGKTLAELGEDFGVTRERIRQLEAALRRDLREAGPACGLVHSAVAHRFGPCAPVEEIAAALPGLRRHPDCANSTLLDLLPLTADGGAPEWRVDEGWLLAGDVDDRIAAALAANADRHGIAGVAEVAEAVGLREDTLAARLAATTRCEVRDGMILTGIGSIPERAATELALAGEPLTTDQLTELIPDRSPRSIVNALSVSDLTRRCAVDTWALAEWEMEEWTSIVDFIKRRIAESDSGEVPLDGLAAEAAELGVKPGSVHAYAATPEFTVADGMVRLAEDLDEVDIDATPEESKALYLRDGAWRLLVTVTRDHLRGSGTGVPGGVVAVHGLRYGQAAELPSRLGPQRLSWSGVSTSTGTVSRFMEDLGCAEGDRVWLVFGEEFDVVPATPRRDGLTGVAELLNATGLDDVCDAADVDEALAAVNEAVGLPADAARRKTVSRFRHRRDDDLAELVREL